MAKIIVMGAGISGHTAAAFLRKNQYLDTFHQTIKVYKLIIFYYGISV